MKFNTRLMSSCSNRTCNPSPLEQRLTFFIFAQRQEGLLMCSLLSLQIDELYVQAPLFLLGRSLPLLFDWQSCCLLPLHLSKNGCPANAGRYPVQIMCRTNCPAIVGHSVKNMLNVAVLSNIFFKTFLST